VIESWSCANGGRYALHTSDIPFQKLWSTSFSEWAPNSPRPWSYDSSSNSSSISKSRMMMWLVLMWLVLVMRGRGMRRKREASKAITSSPTTLYNARCTLSLSFCVFILPQQHPPSTIHHQYNNQPHPHINRYAINVIELQLAC
jgi:hypothetical protein